VHYWESYNVFKMDFNVTIEIMAINY